METFSWLRPYGRQFGDSRRQGAWHIGKRCLLDFLLIYVQEGQGTMTVNGETLHVQNGDLIWIPPNTPHEMWGHEPFMDLAYVHFDLIYRTGGSDWDFTIPAGTTDLRPFGPMLHPELPRSPMDKLCGRLQLYNHQQVGTLISSMASEALASRNHFEYRISGLLMEMVGEILTGLVGDTISHHQAFSPGLEKASHYLGHCENMPTVEQAADIAGLSPSHFRKLFKKQYGCSPKTWMSRARLAKTKQLMGNPLLNFTQIAEVCGFANLHHFSRTFSESEGISPSQYRQYGGKHFQVETSLGKVPSKHVPTR
jgi:AraC-like DNA-binding protein